MQVAIGMTPPTPVPLATVAEMVRDTLEPLLPRRLLKKYDKNHDLHLDAAELHWPAGRLKETDADGNGRLDLAELARIGEATPDVVLSVDLKARETWSIGVSQSLAVACRNSRIVGYHEESVRSSIHRQSGIRGSRS